MGRQKHILLFALAFVVLLLQRDFNIFQFAFDSHTVYWMIVCTLSVQSVILGSWGHILRTRARLNIRYLFYISLLVLAATYLFTDVFPHAGLSKSLYLYFNVSLLFAIGVVILKHRAKPLPAEKGAAISYFLMALSQVAAASMALMQGRDTDAFYWNWYNIINLVTMPAAFIAMGLFVVFSLASDLSAKMRLLAMTDSLVDCYNRRGFYEQAKQDLIATNEHQQLCLLYLDIDNFKAINDTHGHDAGDMVLVDTIKLVKENIKACDIIGRLGGEEFVILLKRADRESAQGVAERLRAVIASQVVDYHGITINVTASFGVFNFEHQPESIETAINQADKALYQAKAMGRNKVVFAS
ncbi:GGDEF domain-containing protein [Thalassotalea sp. Y01]|uniref:GGDEF domain-containing protein n=1 Tax=Thalassotalea sp. Y01 TaxID=2729613 RepID=UPI0020071BF1|nr:GGDEF domain-containing protein [Thalassotalea sp. Y01]